MRLNSVTRQIKSLNYSLNKKSYYPGAGYQAPGVRGGGGRWGGTGHCGSKDTGPVK